MTPTPITTEELAQPTATRYTPHDIVDAVERARERNADRLTLANRRGMIVEIMADDLLDALSAQQGKGWRPISEYLPNKIMLLFVVTDVADDCTVRNWEMGTGHFSKGHEGRDNCTGWIWTGHALKTYELQPTHCMECPAPPTQGETT